MIYMWYKVLAIAMSGVVVSDMQVKVFRDALRLSHQIPSQAIKRKFQYNMREIAEYYLFCKDVHRVEEINNLAKGALESLRRLLSSDDSTTRSIFRPLEYADRIEESLNSKKFGWLVF